jgi:hypothetical protein
MEKKQKNGAAQGGNIALIVACLAIILLPFVGWFIAGPLLLAAFICSIVAIAQNAARQGIVLMFGSILMPIIAQLVGIAMWAGIDAAGSNEAKKQQDQQPRAVSTAYNTVQTQPAQTVSQPQAAPVIIATFSGKGGRNTRPFTVTGPWEIQWDAKGEVFGVALRTADGKIVGVPASQFHPGQDSSYQPKPGQYYLDVTCSGSWTIKIVQLGGR